MPDTRILIAEDEAIEALNLQNSLAEMGYPLPDVVYRGEDAVSKAREMRPDLMLMDIRMPGKIDGIDAAEQIRAFLDIPIIFLTGHFDEATLRRARATEPYVYLLKPYGDAQIRIAIDNAVYKHASDRKIRESEAALRASEEALQKAHDLLEHRVQERTAELQAANKEMEAFSYSVSHDLRAPLRSIDGFSRVLLQTYVEKLDEKGKDYLNRVRAAAQKMGSLIDDMLTLSRITRKETKPGAVDLSALARKISGELQKTQPGRRVDFVIEEGLIASGDAELLEAMLENLFSNAWKFTSKHPRAKIEFGATRSNGETAYFVRDDGAGFDMAYAAKLFAPFQRLHSADEFPGNGIGLATVQRIVQRSSGRVWAEGGIEKGATIYFTLNENNLSWSHGTTRER